MLWLVRRLSDQTVSHILIPRRDRLARPNDPSDAIVLEGRLRKAGITLVYMDKLCPPFSRGKPHDLADRLTAEIDYAKSGEFRRTLAEKILYCQLDLAQSGYSVGGRPPYGFRRYLVKADGQIVRQLEAGERVRTAGQHVVWLPGPNEEVAVVKRILTMLETMSASRVAASLTADAVPSPDTGRMRTDNNITHPTSGVWHANTVTNVARNPLVVAIATYGRRSMGDQLRFGPTGPRELEDGDYRYAEGSAPKVIRNPESQQVRVNASFEPLVDPTQHEKLLVILDARAGSQKGKPRSRDPENNPLGGRVFDMNCGWPMYRTVQKGL